MATSSEVFLEDMWCYLALRSTSFGVGVDSITAGHVAGIRSRLATLRLGRSGFLECRAHFNSRLEAQALQLPPVGVPNSLTAEPHIDSSGYR